MGMMNSQKITTIFIHGGDKHMAHRLHGLPGVEVLTETSQIDQAVSEIHANHPDVVILNDDAHLADRLLFIHRLTHENPPIPVMVLLTESNEQRLSALLGAGAAGCVLKDIEDKDLLKAIQALKRKESYLSPALAKFLITNVQQDNSALKK